LARFRSTALLDRRHDRGDDPTPALTGRRDSELGGNGSEYLADLALGEGDEQVLLVPEILVERTDADARPFGNCRGAEALDAIAHENLRSSGEERVHRALRPLLSRISPLDLRHLPSSPEQQGSRLEREFRTEISQIHLAARRARGLRSCSFFLWHSVAAARRGRRRRLLVRDARRLRLESFWRVDGRPVGTILKRFSFRSASHRRFSLRLRASAFHHGPRRRVAVPVALFGQEFCYYWFHRASHRVRWFWATHAVHHSPEQLTFAAAFRLGLTARFTGSTLFYVPLSYLGFAPKVVLLGVTVNLLYQFWIHSERIPRLGPLELVLNTPSHHRVHHARNLDYLDANYGGVLIVFDRMFGTFVREKPELRCDFGLVHPIRSYNPIVVEMHGWMALLRDLRTARSLRAVLGYLFGPPGWSADGPGTTTRELRGQQSSMSKPAQGQPELARPAVHQCGDADASASTVAGVSAMRAASILSMIRPAGAGAWFGHGAKGRAASAFRHWRLRARPACCSRWLTHRSRSGGRRGLLLRWDWPQSCSHRSTALVVGPVHRPRRGRDIAELLRSHDCQLADGDRPGFGPRDIMDVDAAHGRAGRGRVAPCCRRLRAPGASGRGGNIDLPVVAAWRRRQPRIQPDGLPDAASTGKLGGH
jgi:sterol desaturase/sphingolipid hydroxylase (fatty acid hydroxylase superfamily)